MPTLIVNNTDVRECSKCKILYRRGPHMFFATPPAKYEESLSSECPKCKTTTSTSLASTIKAKNFNYLYEDDHGIADLEGDDSWMATDLSREPTKVEKLV